MLHAKLLHLAITDESALLMHNLGDLERLINHNCSQPLILLAFEDLKVKGCAKNDQRCF